MVAYCLRQPSTNNNRVELLNDKDIILGSGTVLLEIPPLFARYHNSSRDRLSTTPLLDQQKSPLGRLLWWALALQKYKFTLTYRLLKIISRRICENLQGDVEQNVQGCKKQEN